MSAIVLQVIANKLVYEALNVYSHGGDWLETMLIFDFESIVFFVPFLNSAGWDVTFLVAMKDHVLWEHQIRVNGT